MNEYANMRFDDYQITVENPPEPDRDLSIIDLINIMVLTQGGRVYFSFTDVGPTGLNTIKSFGLHLYKFDTAFDFGFDFSSDDFKSLGSLKHIETWATNLAQKIQAKDYYCGYEPAVDLNTRFFTGDRLGPLGL